MLLILDCFKQFSNKIDILALCGFWIHKTGHSINCKLIEVFKKFTAFTIINTWKNKFPIQIFAFNKFLDVIASFLLIIYRNRILNVEQEDICVSTD